MYKVEIKEAEIHMPDFMQYVIDSSQCQVLDYFRERGLLDTIKEEVIREKRDWPHGGMKFLLYFSHFVKEVELARAQQAGLSQSSSAASSVAH